jgi:hypothetical protein
VNRFLWNLVLRIRIKVKGPSFNAVIAQATALLILTHAQVTDLNAGRTYGVFIGASTVSVLRASTFSCFVVCWGGRYVWGNCQVGWSSDMIRSENSQIQNNTDIHYIAAIGVTKIIFAVCTFKKYCNKSHIIIEYNCWNVSVVEITRTSETSVSFYQTTRHSCPEDSHLFTSHRKNLKSHLLTPCSTQMNSSRFPAFL